MPNLRNLTKSEINTIAEECWLNEELVCILCKLSHGDSVIKISMDMGLSTATVARRIKQIKDRIRNYNEKCDIYE